MGIISSNIHLYGSFVLLFFLFYHTKNPVKKTFASLFLVSYSLIPTLSYSFEHQLSNIKTQKDVIYHSNDWTNSTKCKSCHSEIFNQWANSNHKNLVESNPYYMVMEAIAGEVEGEKFKQWCMSCHNPSALTTGLTRTSHSMNDNFLFNTLFEKDAKTLVDTYEKHGNSRLEEGVSCLTCHRITDATNQGNASYSIELTNRKKYPFEDDESTIKEYLGHKFINAKPNVHKESYMKPLYKDSKYCASCHGEASHSLKVDTICLFVTGDVSS